MTYQPPLSARMIDPKYELAEKEGTAFFRSAFNLHHVTCDACLRHHLPEPFGAESFEYHDSQHEIDWMWYIPRARRIIERDNVQAVPMPVHAAWTALGQAKGGIDMDHVYHIPDDKMLAPVIVATLPVPPFHHVTLIDGAHRLAHAMLGLYIHSKPKPPLMYVLDHHQSLEAMVVEEDATQAIDLIREVERRLAAGEPVDAPYALRKDMRR